MLDILKKLPIKSMITIDDAVAENFSIKKDFTVKDNQLYEYDDQEIIILNLGTNYLIGSNITGASKFFLCEIFDEGSRYYGKKRFLRSLILDGGEEKVKYYQTQAIYAEDDSGASFAEYESDAYFNRLLVNKLDDEIIVFCGVEISESSIVI